MAETTKPIQTLVLDTGAIIRNEPPVSTLLAKSEQFVTTPAIISEIRDAATRSRVTTTLVPFLTQRTPSPASVQFVTDFARRTGDLAVLSKADIQIIALTYEIECERNGGDWRLRKTPGQKRVNGAPPAKPQEEGTGDVTGDSTSQATEETVLETPAPETAQPENAENVSEEISADDLTSNLAATTLHENTETTDPTQPATEEDSDSEGWITPSNLKKQQAKDAGASTVQADEPKTMQVAVLTTDFAMQNVILQINLNLISPTMTRIKHLRTFVLRCHACFQVSKDMSKQFCTRCGGPSLTRVACSTNANGEFKLHLKKNMQWNTRGDRYSIPKPVHGSSNGRIQGGGKNGWGNELILTEDQKEYQSAAQKAKRQKERSLMDEDYLPDILTGNRRGNTGRIKVGAGKNINSKKR